MIKTTLVVNPTTQSRYGTVSLHRIKALSVQIVEYIYYFLETRKSKQKPKKTSKKGKEKARQYTPETDPYTAFVNDPAYRAGFPDWSQEIKYQHLYKHLSKVEIPNRPPTLPTIYEYIHEAPHPLRHLIDMDKPHKTYVYIYDSSKEGAAFASVLEYFHKIPQGSTQRMKELGIYSILPLLISSIFFKKKFRSSSIVSWVLVNG